MLGLVHQMNGFTARKAYFMIMAKIHKQNMRYLLSAVTLYAMLRWQQSAFGGINVQDWSASHFDASDGAIPSVPFENDSDANSFPLIGIFVAADTHAQELYDKNLKSIQCYGKRHGYDVLLVSDLNATHVTSLHHHRTIDLIMPPTAESRASCSTLRSFSFQRQCVATRILPHYDFLVVLDADVGVANANITMESILLRAARDEKDDKNWLESSSTATSHIPHVILEERFHTGEIMAATFILQNTSFAQQFLNRWIGFYDTLPEPQFLAPNKYVNKFYHNKRDNPSLNMAFVKTLAEVATIETMRGTEKVSNELTPYQPMIDTCHRLWKISIGSRKYMNYLHCINNMTVTIVAAETQKKRPHYHHHHPKTIEKDVLFPLYLFRRGHSGLGRDIQTCDGRVSPLDVFVHNLKEQSSIVQHTSGFYKETPTCHHGNDDDTFHWQAPVSNDRWRSMEEMQALMKTPACLAGATNIGDCWPDCSLTTDVP